jgi:hypothetical protein
VFEVTTNFARVRTSGGAKRRLAAGVVVLLGLLAAPLWPAQGARIGTLTLNGTVPGTCPGGQCKGFRVVCNGAQAAINGFYSDRPPAGTAKGVVVFFTGSGGTSWWSENSAAGAQMLSQLVGEGYRVVEVKWASPWQVAQSGERAGPANLACRPATVIKYVHDSIYVPLGLNPSAGKCGFCVTGHSNGSSQVGYAGAFYGLAGIIDGLFPTAGPTYAALSSGCQGQAGYDYVALSQAGAIDKSYGFSSGGPCAAHTSSWAATWTAHGVATGGSSYAWPSTRVQFVVGANDGFKNHAAAMRDRLLAAGGNQVLYQEIPGMGHSIYTNSTGLSALHGAIVDAPIVVPPPSGGGKGGGGGTGGGTK